VRVIEKEIVEKEVFIHYEVPVEIELEVEKIIEK
jgi:hypothetical protein